MENKNNYTILPRGGYLVSTPTGYVQVGAPPETIKDTMVMEKGVPQVFIIADKMFDWIKGISLAEIEFPIYFNFFIKKRKTLIICHEDQYTRMIKVLQEALFGPEKLAVEQDYDLLSWKYNIPDLKNEMDFFRNNLKFEDVLLVGIFRDNKYTYNDLTITQDNDKNFDLYFKNQHISHVPGKLEYKAAYKIGERLNEPYRPPLFSITCLGPSHGFDPTENTSGYIIWLNHHGIMIDPPVNSTEWLEDSNVNPKLIDSIILTHCHADHDAGTFQKILREEKVTIYTTKTVMMSFLRKYAALSDVSISSLEKLFYFHPVQIGKPVFIHGGKFDMSYSLHSIPTLSFRMEFEDQSFVYSSDHNNDPAIHKTLFDKNIITPDRYNELRNFPWNSKVIYHEAGIPPLHTPVSFLNSLDVELQKKIVVYHIAKKDFPEKTHLTLAKFGIENTLDFATTPPPFEKSYQVMNILSHIDAFQNLPVRKAQEFLMIVKEEHYSKGNLIIQKGTMGDKFYMIASGNVSIPDENLKEKKIYGTYEYFGEVSLLTNQPRAADVIAETDVILYTIERDKFLNFITDTPFDKMLRRLIKIRSTETWNLLSTSKFFQYCTSTQKTLLESIFIPMEFEGNCLLIKENEKIDYIYIIRKGTVSVIKNDKMIGTLGKGDFVGSLKRVYRGDSSNYTYHCKEPLSVYAMPSKDIYNFLNNNPGIIMKLDYNFGEETD